MIPVKVVWLLVFASAGQNTDNPSEGMKLVSEKSLFARICSM